MEALQFKKIGRYRRLAVIGVELTLVVLANYLAFLLRFEGEIPPAVFRLFAQTLPFVVLIRALVFIPFRLYEGLWRYTSIWDLRNIIAAVLSSTILIYVSKNLILDLGYPRSVIIIDSLLLIFFMSGIRLSRRIYREMRGASRGKGILVYGAGDAGEMVVRDMRNNPYYQMDPIGFIDDDPAKVGHRIHGVPVLGTRKDLRAIMSRGRVQEVLIAMPTASSQELREVLKALETFKVPITTLPNLRDLLDVKVTVNQIRSLALEDLLQRAPVGLDPLPVQKLVAGRRVAVTGAGGSIGAELCRQIARMNPAQLLLLERHEHSLYTIHKDLDQRGYRNTLPRIVDVTDRRLVRATLEELRPDIVFHAAAHKHVPMMEMNPCEAIKNNVTGTRIMAEESEAVGVERFILISTDKAVNPTSVMGASKRVAELVVRGLSKNSRTSFSAVRFGNVLGSNGSVVPLFLEQIHRGGPVTVTDPEMRRYFMLIPEAVQLVLHAATIGENGAVYVLDMGEDFKVVELARNLIRLSGFVPDEEIAIEFIGLRPGEKLFETLVGTEETVEAAPVDKIRRIHSTIWQEDRRSLDNHVLKLEAAAVTGHTPEVIELLCEIVPTFKPDPIRAKQKIVLSEQSRAAAAQN